MSDFDIGEKDGEWELLERNRQNGRIELWHNPKSGFYGVYLYEHVGQDEEWLSWKETKDQDRAAQISDTIADMLA